MRQDFYLIDLEPADNRHGLRVPREVTEQVEAAALHALCARGLLTESQLQRCLEILFKRRRGGQE